MIYQRLKDLREDADLTQKQVADSAKLFPQGYQVYEYGREPSVALLCKLADAYNVSIDYLVGRSDNPQRL